MRRAFLVTIPLLIAAAALCLAADKIKALDEGLLDPGWFGDGVGPFLATEEIDYLWVKDGFTVKDKTIRIEPWDEFKFLQPKKRDSKDAAKAGELTDVMPSRLRGALSQSLDGVAKVSKEDGDILLKGRFVDVNAGSKAAKWLVGFGAGAATATWDVKFVDKASGEVVAALHHRAISGTNMSEIDDKIAKWLDRFGLELKSDLITYKNGKTPKK